MKPISPLDLSGLFAENAIGARAYEFSQCINRFVDILNEDETLGNALVEVLTHGDKHIVFGVSNNFEYLALLTAMQMLDDVSIQVLIEQSVPSILSVDMLKSIVSEIELQVSSNESHDETPTIEDTAPHDDSDLPESPIHDGNDLPILDSDTPQGNEGKQDKTSRKRKTD